jgi:hypothetical protein
MVCLLVALTCAYLLNANINSPCQQQLVHAATRTTVAAASSAKAAASLMLPEALKPTSSKGDSSNPAAEWLPSTNSRDLGRYSADLHMIQSMLRLTKLSELTAPRLLEAVAPAALDTPGLAKLMQLHNEAYCR